MRRLVVRWATTALALVVLTVNVVCDPRPSEAERTKRPNIVVILTDDQRWDDLKYMPALDAASEWARFTNSFVHEPQCCPSRATFFTGRYSRHTGVTTLVDGKDLNEKRTIATMLDAAAYRTGQFGKYLNGYPFGRGHYVPPGWDEFAAYQGPTYYFDYTLIENGTLVTHGSRATDYSTDVFARMGREFIHSTNSSVPLFLYLSLNAPHRASGFPVPAPRHDGLCGDLTEPAPPSFNAYDTVSEPPWMRGERPVDPFGVAIERARRCQSLRAVDEAVSSIMAALDRVGRLENTYIVFTSDNGYALGEHRLLGKGDLYDPSIRVPLLVRGPGIEGRTIERLTSNVDLVPTILDWAGVKAPRGFLDGTSFAENVSGRGSGRTPQEVLLRGCRTMSGGKAVCGGYPSNMGSNWGIRTSRYKYVEYRDGYVQLFDLAVDPFELTNVASDPARAMVMAHLHARLRRMRGG